MGALPDGAFAIPRVYPLDGENNDFYSTRLRHTLSKVLAPKTVHG
jgi:hypothetical protein